MGGRRHASETHRTRTDPRGLFELPYAAGSRVWSIISFGLKAELEGYICTEPPTCLKPNAEPQKIVMHGTGTIEGALVLPEGAPIRKLEIVVARTSDEDPSERKFVDCVDADGRFSLKGILPCEVTVAFFLKGTPDELATTPGVTVRRHRTTTIPPIDLREHPALRR